MDSNFPKYLVFFFCFFLIYSKRKVFEIIRRFKTVVKARDKSITYHSTLTTHVKLSRINTPFTWNDEKSQLIKKVTNYFSLINY